MANHLVDFVMAVARDPAVAAAYAEDPAGTLAGAHLGDVTPADVDTLLPMLTDAVASAPFASTTPSSLEAGTGEVGPAGGDVWASGAATAAFDSFGPVDAARAGVGAATDSGVDGWPVLRYVSTFFGGDAVERSHAVPAGDTDGAADGNDPVDGPAPADGHDAASGVDATSDLGTASGGDAFLDSAHAPVAHGADHPSDPGSFDLF